MVDDCHRVRVTAALATSTRGRPRGPATVVIYRRVPVEHKQAVLDAIGDVLERLTGKR